MQDEFKKAYDASSSRGVKTENYYLIFSRAIWESEGAKQSGFTFSKEELDAAEKLSVKLIGERMGVKCYLPSPL